MIRIIRNTSQALDLENVDDGPAKRIGGLARDATKPEYGS